MRAACHSEPVLAAVAGGASDDGMPSGLFTLDRARSLESPESEDSQLETTDYNGWRAQHPCLLTNFEGFREQLNGRRLAVFLDYDGTLTPIVSNPDEATMSDQMRDAVRQVAGMFPTAIISGRGREKVEAFVQLPELYYAGSHGMDIVGPRGAAVNGAARGGGGGGEPFRFQAAAEYEPLIDRVYARLRESLVSIPGASVEHNKFCVSAHFRNCHPDSWQRVVAAVEGVVAAAGGGRLHMTRGRKVLEVRPTVDWDKGSALLHLLDALGLSGQPDVTAIYLGDDKTDEDAFAALAGAGAGAGVLVSTVAKPTAAAFTLRDPGEVLQLLRALLAYGAGEGNGWRAFGGSCNGWAPAGGGGGGGEARGEQEAPGAAAGWDAAECSSSGQQAAEGGGGAGEEQPRSAPQQEHRPQQQHQPHSQPHHRPQQHPQQHPHQQQQHAGGGKQQRLEAEVALGCSSGRCQA
ncbi:MAG: trehalose-phosphatase-domain-containing protein [Monoraphidium minutum]|nr:MAG: trehalose-phosphatase-domain-containing protein [Monoraphidium minutum]